MEQPPQTPGALETPYFTLRLSIPWKSTPSVFGGNINPQHNLHSMPRPPICRIFISASIELAFLKASRQPSKRDGHKRDRAVARAASPVPIKQTGHESAVNCGKRKRCSCRNRTKPRTKIPYTYGVPIQHTIKQQLNGADNQPRHPTS